MLVCMVVTASSGLTRASSVADVVVLLSSAFPPVPFPSSTSLLLVSEISLQLLLETSETHP